jgi:hypothetical protein
MIDLYQSAVAPQFEAAFCTLARCVDACPDSLWHQPVGNLKLCQVAFHVLFFADLYLGPNEAAVRQQPFHRKHAAVFADYEELEPVRQKALYEKPFILTYLQHCREKAVRTMAAETAESLAGQSGFERLNFPRGELHVYNIRHLQHHAAQLSLRLRIDAGVEIPWVGSGWRSG